MATAIQKAICEALGFEAPDQFDGWNTGAFGHVSVIGLPRLSVVNEAMKDVGFTWNQERQAWQGSDETAAQVEVLQALDFCSGRYYRGAVPAWAVTAGAGKACPVKVGQFVVGA